MTSFAARGGPSSDGDDDDYSASDRASTAPSSPLDTPSPTASPALISTNPDEAHFRIGFIAPPFKDNKIPDTDHLHAHAYIAPADLMGWWRAVGYSAMAWYDVDDLIAEIR